MREEITRPPRGLMVLALVGPSLVWCAEYIGSGEVVLATRTGALMGMGALWAVVIAILLKYSIGLAGAHWATVTGEGMIDLFGRLPGPRYWLVWLVLAIQFLAAIVSIGALANLAGTFLNSLITVPGGRVTWGVAASLFAVAVAWSGKFNILKIVMSGLVAVIVVGVFYVALRTMPPLAEIGRGLIGAGDFAIPDWAADKATYGTAWGELLPLMGWAAGGFASQVWYTYWVLGAGYGMARGRGWGKPADLDRLRALTAEDGRRLAGWCRVVRTDATLAAILGILVTTGFMMAGAGVLRPEQLVPEGKEVALTLSRLFSDHWGKIGGALFLLAGSAAMISTLVGQLSGWPRLLADCFRLVSPPFAKLPWSWQFRGFLAFFVVTNAVAIVLFDPVLLVKLGGQLDGILLTPIQALALLVAMVFVLPRLLPRDVWQQVRPGPVLLTALAVSFLVFGTMCVLVLPGSLKNLLFAS